MSKKNKQRCSGITYLLKNCDRYVYDEEIYCGPHDYFSNMTDEQFQLVLDQIIHYFEGITRKEVVDICNKSGVIKCCPRHGRFHFGKTNKCSECNEDTTKKWEEKKAKKIRCKGKMRSGKECWQSPDENSEFCSVHQYLSEYTPEQLAVIQLCNGCKMYKFIEENYKQCQTCRERGEVNRMKKKKALIDVDEYDDNQNVIIKHTDDGNINKNILNDKVVKRAKKNGITIIPNNSDEGVVNKNINQIIEITVDDNNIKQTCNTCGKTQNKTNFIGQRGQNVKTCKRCRDLNKKADDKRKGVRYHTDKISIIEDKQICHWCKEEQDNSEFIGDRGQQTKTCRKCRNKEKLRKAQMTPEQKEKASMGYRNYRKRLIEKIGLDEYHKLYAQQAKKWREKNPEKVQKANEEKKYNIKIKLAYYKNKAGKDGKKWDLSDDIATKFMNGNCYYCNKGVSYTDVNGIDRLDSFKDYILENCVSCCSVCNYMKNCIDPITFIKRCMNIAIYQNKLDDKLDYTVYQYNINQKSYNDYKKRAKNELELEFELTQDEFNNIITNNCHYCGISNNDNNKNGIDRKDSTKGYTMDNSISSCSSCNYMKKNYDYNKFVEKMKKIYEYSKQYLDFMMYEEELDLNKYDTTKIKIFPKQLKNIIKNPRQKPTKEERKEQFIKNKKNKDEILKTKLLDEDYQMKKAKEIRIKKQNNIYL